MYVHCLSIVATADGPERQHAGGDVVERDAGAPQVDAGAERLLHVAVDERALVHVRKEVLLGAAYARELHLVVDLSCRPEVRQLVDVLARRQHLQQDVVRLDVAVHYLQAVQLVHAVRFQQQQQQGQQT